MRESFSYLNIYQLPPGPKPAKLPPPKPPKPPAPEEKFPKLPEWLLPEPKIDINNQLGGMLLPYQPFYYIHSLSKKVLRQ